MSAETALKARPKTRAAAKRPAKRDAILAAAGELFLEVGYGAASINLLVERVGGSKSTVYAHFENKEKLFEAVVEKVVGEVTSSLRQVDPSGMELRRGLELIGGRLLGLVLSGRHIGLLRLVTGEASRFPEIGRIYYRVGPAAAYRGLEEFLAEHSGRGAIQIDDVARAADYFAGMLLHRRIFERFCIVPQAPPKRQVAVDVKGVVERFIRAYSGQE